MGAAKMPPPRSPRAKEATNKIHVPMETPVWASLSVVAMVVGSFAATLYITPRLFVDDEDLKASRFGVTSAHEVVSSGGYPLYILGAIPYFLLMIAGEYFISTACNLPCVAGRYDFSDTWSSITAGITQQFGAALVKVPLKLGVVPYSYIYYTYAVPNNLTVSLDSGWTWMACFVTVDCAYYWLHRLCHEIGFMWAGHAVHHSSEHYNLSTALRQSWWQAILAPFVYLPLALCFPPALYAALEQLNIVYQFWVHTCLVRRLPFPLELLLMTPSHHRVHHDRRVHKNFGGVFIVWDRLFGSFLDEEDAIRTLKEDNAERVQERADGKGEEFQEEVLLFGVMPVVETYTEAVTQSLPWMPIARAAWTGSVRATLAAVWYGPGYHTAGKPRTLKAPSASSIRLRRLPAVSAPASRYVQGHFLLTIAVGFGVLLAKHAPLFLVRFPLAAASLLSLYSQGLLLDARKGGEVAFERHRCLGTLAIAAAALVLGAADVLPACCAALSSTPFQGAMLLLIAASGLSLTVLPASDDWLAVARGSGKSDASSTTSQGESTASKHAYSLRQRCSGVTHDANA